MKGNRMLQFRAENTPLTEDQKLIRKQVLHQIETYPETFNMFHWDSTVQWKDSCGTTRCIAGWAAYFAGCPVRAGEGAVSIVERAVKVLGLTSREFYGANCTRLFFDPDGAAARMRELNA